MAASLIFFVPGTPVPQGSADVYNGRLVSVKKPLREWRDKIRAAAMLAAGPDWAPIEGPVAVDLKFQVERPKTVTRARPSVKPDLDKLTRAAFDSLSTTKKQAGVIRDDARITDYSASKRYAAVPGVLVTVTPIEC